MSYPYQPFYCEENAYSLLSESPLEHLDPYMMFISNATRQVMMFQQSAGAAPSGAIVWDYHVVVLAAAGMEIWDLDSLSGFPLPLSEYLTVSFGAPGLAPKAWEPRFRLLSQRDAFAMFSTNRSHMLDADGEYLKPPPPWDPPANGPPSLQRILSPDAGDAKLPQLQPWMDRDSLITWADRKQAA